jgi:hypothetical protein
VTTTTFLLICMNLQGVIFAGTLFIMERRHRKSEAEWSAIFDRLMKAFRATTEGRVICRYLETEHGLKIHEDGSIENTIKDELNH